MSTHAIPVVRLEAVAAHPNADRLDIATIGGYTSVVARGEYRAGDLCVFVPPDYVVPVERPEFAFLASRAGDKPVYRIRAMKLRGVRSFGLVIPVPAGDWREGDDLMEHLGVVRYEPAEPMGGGPVFTEEGPALAVVHYDLENLQGFPRVFQAGEPVIVTGKIHGQGGRFVWHEGRMYCGSRRQWRLPEGSAVTLPDGTTATAPAHSWSRCLEQNPWITAWCQAHPDAILYGEVYGPGVQGGRFHYGKGAGQYGFAVFDVMRGGRFVDNADLVDAPEYDGLERVEVLYRGPFDFEALAALAELDETYNGCDHLREGVVVKPERERTDLEVGRAALKYVSVRYYEKS